MSTFFIFWAIVMFFIAIYGFYEIDKHPLAQDIRYYLALGWTIVGLVVIHIFF